MNKGTAVVILIVVLGGGYGLGRLATRGKDDGGNTASASVAKPSAADSKNAVGIGDGVDRFRVPLEGAVEGPARRQGDHRRVLRLPVPVLQRASTPTVEADREGLRQEGPRRLQAQPAALPPERAAGRRGRARGRRAGQVLGDARQALREPAEPRRAPTSRSTRSEIGLDVDKFKAALDRHGKCDDRSKADKAAAARVGARGTPAFFINGRKLSGAQPFDDVQGDHRRGARQRRQALVKAGVARGQVYAALHRERQDRAPPAPAAPQRPSRRSPTDAAVYKVPRRRLAAPRAPRRAKVTIVEFSDFQCPFCSRVEPDASKQIEKTYGTRRARACSSNNPLPVPPQRQAAPPRPRWPPTSRASSGRCTTSCSPTSRRSTRRPREVRRGDRPRHGQVQGGARRATSTRSAIEDDSTPAAQVGARGTPTFFINGRDAARRAALRGVQGGHRRGDRRRTTLLKRRRQAARTSTPSSTKDGLDKAAAAAGAAPGAPDADTRLPAPTSATRR